MSISTESFSGKLYTYIVFTPFGSTRCQWDFFAWVGTSMAASIYNPHGIWMSREACVLPSFLPLTSGGFNIAAEVHSEGKWSPADNDPGIPGLI